MKTSLFIFFLLLITHMSVADTLIAGLFNIVPYAYIENEKVVGITPEIISAIQQVSEIPIKMKLLPYKRMLEYLEDGKIDFAVFFLSEYSNSFSDNLIGLYSLETVVVGEKDLDILRYDDLFNLRLCTPLGVNYNSGLEIDREKMDIRYVNDYKNAILMLKAKRIDAIVAPKEILKYQLELEGMNIEELGKPFYLSTNTAWIQFSDKSKKQNYKKQLTKSGEILLDNGTISKIIEKYYSK